MTDKPIELRATAAELGIPDLQSKARTTLHERWSGNWNMIFRAIAVWFTQAWVEFERTRCQRLAQLHITLRDAMTSFETRCRQLYQAAHDEALGRFKLALRDAISKRRQASMNNRLRIEELKSQEPQVLDHLNRVKIAMAGDEDAHIPIRRARNTLGWVLAITTGLVVGAIEYLTGYGIWQYQSDANIALGLSLITVLAPLALSHIAVTALRRHHANQDAVKTFAKRYPTGQAKGYSVAILPSSDYRIGRLCLWTLIAASGLLLGSRLWIVYTGDGEFGGAAGSIGLVLVVLVYAAVEYFIVAAPYAPHQYGELSQVQGAMDGLNAELQDLEQASPDAEFEKALADAREQYNADMNVSKTALDARAEELNNQRQEYLGLTADYASMADLFTSEYMEAVRETIPVIVEKYHLDGTTLPFGQDDEDTRIRKMYSEARVLQYNDAALIDQIRGHEFEGQIPQGVRLIEFDTIERVILESSAINVPAV